MGPINSYDYIDKIKEMYSNKKKKVEDNGPEFDEQGNVQNKIEYKDPRLTYINL